MSDWLTRFSIKTRLISLLILLAATAAGLTMAGLNGMRSSNADINQMYNNVLLPLDKLGDLTNHMHALSFCLLCNISLVVRSKRHMTTPRACISMLWIEA